MSVAPVTASQPQPTGPGFSVVAGVAALGMVAAVLIRKWQRPGCAWEML